MRTIKNEKEKFVKFEKFELIPENSWTNKSKHVVVQMVKITRK